jgi:hypothetical protein
VAVLRSEIERGLDEVVRPFLALVTALHDSLGGRTEIRILGHGSVWSGLIGPDDVNAAVASLHPVATIPRSAIPRGDHPRSGEAGIYFTLGAVRLDYGGPVGLPFRRARRTTRDTDIVASPWVVVDVDPEREPKGRSATDPEKAEALAVVQAIRAAFEGRGVPTVLADSGNGYHLLSRAVPATGAAVRDHASGLEQLLRALAGRFSTPAAKVDETVHNAGQIFKLYGTVSPKGPDTAEAPHRLSCINPDAIPPEVDALPRLADLVPPPTRTKSAAQSSRPGDRTGATATAPEWKAWRAEALSVLDLQDIYGDLLTGKSRDGWLECRDPSSPSGDQHPSASVADGTGQAERGSFHSFRTGKTLSAFDFLVGQGRASDFADSCCLVADLTGMPRPARRGHRAATTFRSFAERWTACTGDAERARALDTEVRMALPLPAVERDSTLNELRAASGLPPSTFRAAVAEARRAEKRERRRSSSQAPPATPGLSTVEYVMNSDSVNHLAEKILNVILPSERFFQFGPHTVHVEQGRGPMVLDERNLPGILAAYLELAMVRDTEDGPIFSGYETLPFQFARALIHNPRFRSRLPVLTGYARSPSFDLHWNLIASFGWHQPSGVFYDGPEVRHRVGDVAIRAAIDGFSWKHETDRVNLIGALLTMLTIPHWTRGHPFLAINGNKSGVGKSTLAQVVGAIVEGEAPRTISYTSNEEEMEKRIATRVEAGDRVLIVDNARAKTAIGSAVLERSITDNRPSFRRLGSNTSISRAENDLLFVLTMNMTQLGTDLRRRALPTNLKVAGDVRHLIYAADDPVGDTLAARSDILGELTGMVQSWLNVGQPMPADPARHSTGQRWAATIDAILRHAGMTGFLSNFAESEHAFDADYAAVRDIATAHHAEKFLSAGEWASILVSGVLSNKLRHRDGTPKPARSQATIVGQLFVPYVDETFDAPCGRLVLRQDVPRRGHPPLYGFAPNP